jgi:hypothetical protein
MPDGNDSNQSRGADDAPTLVSVAILAFILADVAHEGFGHGLGFYLAGGQSSMLTTTRLIEWVKLGDPQWRIFDLGGPAGNVFFAGLAWIGQRWVRGRAPRLQLFLWLVMTFSLFWAFGYLIFCGVLGRGDWIALVEGTKYVWPGRLVFVVMGIALYRASISLAAREMRWIVPAHGTNVKSRLTRLVRICYISGGLIACAGAVLDPRGPMEILNSGALSSLGAAVGLLYVTNSFLRLPEKYSPADTFIPRDWPWIVAAAAGTIYYIAILGPGILLWFGNRAGTL